MERALIEAASKRYAWPQPEDRKALDEAYAEAMEAVWRDHPRDADVGALYAEALMDLRPWDLWTTGGEPQPGTQKVVEVLEAVLSVRADHPLACHLYIHAVEASPHPEKAVRAADRLRHLQPGLPHLVHMPSHIDVRLGRWGEAAEANERAIAADRAYRAIRPGQGFYRLYMLHNRHMLAYAALMRGESRRAIAAVDAMLAELPIEWARENAAIADGYFAMPLEVRMRFGRWDEILAAPEPEATFPIARALRHAAQGWPSPHRGGSSRHTGHRRSSVRHVSRSRRTPASATARRTSSWTWPSTYSPARSSIARGGGGGRRRAEGGGPSRGRPGLRRASGLDPAGPARARGGGPEVGPVRGGGGGLSRGPEAVAGQRLVAVRADAGTRTTGPGQGGGRGTRGGRRCGRTRTWSSRRRASACRGCEGQWSIRSTTTASRNPYDRYVTAE